MTQGRHVCAKQIAGLLALLLGAWLSLPVPANAGLFDDLQKRFEKAGLFQGLEISGSNSLTVQENAVQGSESSFTTQRWDTGNLMRQSSIHVEGPIWKEFGFQADISASGFGPSYSRWVAGYVGHDTALYYGALNINLEGNEFASFSKSLKGWQLDQKLPGGGLARAFYSQEKGFTRTETIAGNDTSGPYFLRYTPVIDGSERVKVDEQMLRFGTDYRLDYETGQLWFQPVGAPQRIIPSTSVITVSYESSGYSGSPGDVYGMRAEVPLLNKRMLLGITRLTQTNGGSGVSDTVGYQEDVYNGSGSTGPFDTNFRPIIPNGISVVFRGRQQTITDALIVLVDGTQQLEGVDYDAYRDIGRVIFRRVVPPTALVRIRYYYELQTSGRVGDKNIFGVDLAYRINNMLSLQTSWANSDGGPGGATGSALTSQLRFNMRNFDMVTQWRDVQPSFSYLDTVGFFTNERGLTNYVNWRVNDHIRVSHTLARNKSAQGQTFGYSGYGSFAGTGTLSLAQTGDGILSQDIDTARDDLNVDIAYAGWPTLSLSRQSMSNSGGDRGNSSYTTDSASTRWSLRSKLDFIGSLINTSQTYTDQTGTAQASQRGSDTRRAQAMIRYTPSSTLSVSADIGNNRSTALNSDDKSTSNTMQLSLSWSPFDKLNLNLDHSLSKSNGSVSSGFYGDTFGGYSSYSTALGPGLPSLTDDNKESRYEDASTRLNLSYQAFKNIYLDFNIGSRKYTSGGTVGYLADSNQNSRNLSLTWNASNALAFSATYGTDTMDFLDQGRGAVSNNTLSLTTNFNPQGKPWGLGISLNKQTGESPTYIGTGDRQRYITVPTNLFDLSGNAHYEINKAMSLYGEAGLANFDSGYSAFKKTTAEVGLSYAASRTTSVNFAYRFIKNLAGQPSLPLWGSSGSGEDYLAHTFMLRLQTNFAGGGGRGQQFAPTSSFGSGSGGYGGNYGNGYGGYGGYGGTSPGTFGGYQSGFGGNQGSFGGNQGSFGGNQSGFGAFGNNSGFGAGGTSGHLPTPQPAPFDISQSGQVTGGNQGGFQTGFGDFQQQTTAKPGEPGTPGGTQTMSPDGTATAAQIKAGPRGPLWQIVDRVSRWATPQTAGLWQ